jgi:hypothetical protein
LDLNELKNAILGAINRELGSVQLIPGTKAGVEYHPEDIPTSVAAMSSFELVPHLGYRFEYFNYRYMLIGYLIERGSDYESGQIEIISTAPDKDPQVETYTPDTLYLKKIESQITGNSGVGVEFSTAYDSELSEGGQHQFGLTYKITKAGSIPKIRAFSIAVLSTTEA